MWTHGPGRCWYCAAPFLWPAIWLGGSAPLPLPTCTHVPQPPRADEALVDCVERS